MRSRWGIHPDQSRNRLIFSSSGEKGVAVPIADWGLEFAENMPEPILAAIRAARGSGSGSIEDEEYRQRLQEKFGDRWTRRELVEATTHHPKVKPCMAADRETDVLDDPNPRKPRSKRKTKKTRKAARRTAKEGGKVNGEEREAPVSVPRYGFAHEDVFEQPWHLALWAPNDPQGPTVYINVDSPILEESVVHHQSQFLDVYAEAVAETIRKVFGEVAVAKVAHSQKLTKELPVEVLDRDYRDERSLTVALMGLMAEESLIAHRLKKLGRKHL